MIEGDLVFISFLENPLLNGTGVYLGLGKRGESSGYYCFFWKGRFATFTRNMWKFKVISNIDNIHL
tara:strand:+ start:6384 stop:6581 length:198 start_codon:yes stop_codon:yes gene_type:complete